MRALLFVADPDLAWWHRIGVDGAVTVSAPGAADEVVRIANGRPCDWTDACATHP